MKMGQVAYHFQHRRARVNLIPASRNLFFILVGRIPDKFLASIIFSVFLTTLGIYSFQSSDLKVSFSRINIPSSPTFVQTIDSPGSKKLRAEETIKQVAAASPPQSQIKIPLEEIQYSRKLKMFATSYDKNCAGCSGTTASGLSTGYGVVAVDPKLIPLGTKLYIPGYGIAIAGDTGGSIKGGKIDLGFDNIKTGWWSARFVDVYVLK